jgi:hypothetical protein
MSSLFILPVKALASTTAPTTSPTAAPNTECSSRTAVACCSTNGAAAALCPRSVWIVYCNACEKRIEQGKHTKQENQSENTCDNDYRSVHVGAQNVTIEKQQPRLGPFPSWSDTTAVWNGSGAALNSRIRCSHNERTVVAVSTHRKKRCGLHRIKNRRVETICVLMCLGDPNTKEKHSGNFFRG